MVRHTLIIFIGLLLSLGFSITGIISGHIAQFLVWRGPENSAHKKRSVKGLVLNYISLVLFVSIVGAIQVAIIRNAVACQGNMKGMCAALYSFSARQQGGFFPQLSSEKGRLIFKNDHNGTDYLLKGNWDISFFICPYDQEQQNPKTNLEEYIKNPSYCYLGYIITNDTEMRAFAEAYKKRIAEGLPFDTDLEVPPGMGTGGSDKIFRFRSRDKMSEILKELGWSEEQLGNVPLIWDRCVLAPDQDTPVHRHPEVPTLYPRPTVIHVDYYGGYGDSLRYGEGKWPMTEETLRLFWELENL